MKEEFSLKKKFGTSSQLAFVALNQALRDDFLKSSSSMVYSTLMAIVPGFTFIVTFFGAFGVVQSFVSTLTQWFKTVFGVSAGVQLVALLEKYSENATSLGVVGLVSFMVTMILLINKVWNFINQIYRTSVNRNPLKRFAGFVTFLIVSSLLCAAFISVQSVFNNWYARFLGIAVVEGWTRLIGIFAPYGIAWAVFFLFIYFVPNTKVRVGSAAIGATTGMVIIMVIGSIMTKVTGMAANLSIIYGSFAAVFLFLFLCYIFWAVVFFCVELAYVHQFRPDMVAVKGLPQSPALQLAEGTNIMMLVGSNFRSGKGGTSTKEMIERLAIPDNRLYGFLDLLTQLDFITPTNNGHTEFIPKQPLENLRVQDLVKVLYGLDEMDDGEHDTAGEAVAQQVQQHGVGSLGSLTIDNLLQRV